jgi:hypothetical protein
LTTNRRSQNVVARFPGGGQPTSCRNLVCAHSTGTPIRLAPGALLENTCPSVLDLSLTQPQSRSISSMLSTCRVTTARVAQTRTFSLGLLRRSK